MTGQGTQAAGPPEGSSAPALIVGPGGAPLRESIARAARTLCPDAPNDPCACTRCERVRRLSDPDFLLYLPHGALGGGGEERQWNAYMDHLEEAYAGIRDGGGDSVSPAASWSLGPLRRIRREAGKRPVRGDLRVLVLASIDAMPPLGQNLLLKLLEEPPPYLRILLTAASEEVLLDTVRSRVHVQRLSLGVDAGPTRIPDPDWVGIIESGDLGEAFALARKLPPSDRAGEVREAIRSLGPFLAQAPWGPRARPHIRSALADLHRASFTGPVVADLLASLIRVRHSDRR